jgi:hypothetical protein
MNTNKYSISYNPDTINKDFIILMLNRTEKYSYWPSTGTLLQSIGDEYKAFSIHYDFGNRAYLLLKRDENKDPQGLRSKLAHDPRLSGVTVELVSVCSEPQEHTSTAPQTLYGYWVVSLILNALPELIKSQGEDFLSKFRTLNGKLFLFDKSCKPTDLQIQAWQVRLGKDGVLALHRISFKRFNRQSYEIQKKQKRAERDAIWAFETTTNSLSLLSQSIEEALQNNIPLFTQGIIRHSNVHVKAAPFFDFGSENLFYKSRVGVYHTIEKLVQQFTSRWITITPTKHDLDSYMLMNNPKFWQNRVLNWIPTISQGPLYLIDLIGTGESKSKAIKLQEELSSLMPNFPTAIICTTPKSKALNIVLVHEHEWYESIGQNDPYIRKREFICQHVTIENLPANTTEILVILKELCLKNDLNSGVANFTNWVDFNLKEPYTFSTLHFPSRRDEEGRCSMVTIQPDGKLSFESYSTFSDDILIRPMPDFYTEVNTHVDYIKKNIDISNYRLEGVIINGNGDINIIYRTEMVTMPDQNQLNKAIGSTFSSFPYQLTTPESMASWIQNIFNEPSEVKWDEEKVKTLLTEIIKESKTVNQGKLLVALRAARWIQNKERKFLCSRLQTEFGVTLQLSRNKSNKESFFSFKTNLRYKKIGEEELIYVVGFQDNVGLKPAFSKASHFRHVFTSLQSSMFFEELFTTFDDNSIRLDENTVLPLAFKYVREI